MATDRADWTRVSFEVGRDTLKEWREEHSRRSEEVVELWEHVLSRNPASLADELCTVYEQVCIAALDSARPELALECIRALDERFPRSSRVLRLQAMRYESIGRFETASDLYEKLIESDPANTSYRKRRIAILLGQGKRAEAIKALNEYLELFITDSEGWLQLCDLFLQEGDFARAAHAAEELLLTAPMNAPYLRRVADIRYSQGGMENLELARVYYEQALKYSPNDVRALFGLVLTFNSLLSLGKGGADKKKEYVAGGAAAANRLLQRYEMIEGEATNPEEIMHIISAVTRIQSSFSK